MRISHKKHIPFRKQEKPVVWNIKPGEKIFSYNTITEHVKVAISPKEKQIDFNAIYKEPECIYLPASSHAEAKSKFVEFINHLKNEKEKTQSSEVVPQ